MLRPVLVLALFAVLLGACATDTPVAHETLREITVFVVHTVEVRVTVPVQQTVEVLATVILTGTPRPTYTAYPTWTVAPTSTATPEPPEAPTATFTSEPRHSLFTRWASTDVVQAFKRAGLEAEGIRDMTKEDYGLAPMVARDATRFLIPSLCADCGGRVFSFQSQADLDRTKSYYVEMGRASAIFFSWLFVKDNILVQINGDLPEERARQYDQALQSLE